MAGGLDYGFLFCDGVCRNAAQWLALGPTTRADLAHSFADDRGRLRTGGCELLSASADAGRGGADFRRGWRSLYEHAHVLGDSHAVSRFGSGGLGDWFYQYDWEPGRH